MHTGSFDWEENDYRCDALLANRSLFRDPGPYRDPFWHFGSLLGLYLYFRVPIFSVLASFTRRMSNSVYMYTTMSYLDLSVMSNDLHCYYTYML